jgi:hypothetical protein
MSSQDTHRVLWKMDGMERALVKAFQKVALVA